MQEEQFKGQQEGERVLYVIRPHIIRQLKIIFRAIVVSLVLYFLFERLAEKTELLGEDPDTVVWTISIVAFLAVAGWSLLALSRTCAYVTDRRLVRVEIAFPFFAIKRSYFWNDVAKVKGYAPNFAYRVARIGTVALQPAILPLEDIKVPDVYYYDDLANYLDKILYLFKNHKEQLADLRPFIAKPAGQRY